MDDSRKPSHETIFDDALARPPGERDAFVDRACADDRAMAAHVKELLRGYEENSGFLETPPVSAPVASDACPDPGRRGEVGSDVGPGPAAAGDPGYNQAPREPVPGDHIGHYKLLERIGEGACGIVYMAEQEQPVRRRVALKLIKLGLDTRDFIARFEAERQALALMDHPHIARVFDAGATDTGRPFFVMELVRGIPITRYCDENKLPPPARLELFIQVCHAIQHAHQKGIIHRDIKPSNILVAVNDGEAVPKVIDFGIAKATQGRLTDKTLFTRFHAFIGTPAYSSPEQAEVTNLDVDTRSDIYSLGVLLYELLTGHQPMDHATIEQLGFEEMRRQIREVEPLRPSARVSSLGLEERTSVAHRRNVDTAKLALLLRSDLDWIVMRCLEKDRRRRYETANGLAMDIRRHLDNEPVLARPPSVAYRARKFARRYRTGVAAVAAIIVALSVGVTAALLGFRRAVEQQHATDAARARSQEMVNFIMQKSLPQMQALGRRQAMIESVETAVRYFEQLPTPLRDRETIRAHATALDLLAQAYGNTFWRMTSRDSEASRAAVGQAAALWRQLAESNPTDADAMASALFDEYIFLRDDPNMSGVQRDAMVDEWVRRYRDLEDRFPDNDDVQVGLGRMSRMQAYNSEGSRSPAEAVASGQEAGRIFDALLARKPGDARLLSDRAATWNAEGEAHIEAGDWQTGMQCREAGMAIAEGLLAEDPTNVQYLSLAAVLAMRLMWAESGRAENRLAERVQVARRYLSTLMALDPEDPEWRLLDGMALVQEASAWTIDRNDRGALRANEQAITRFESLPPHSFNRITLIVTVGTTGVYAVLAGEGAVAAAMLKRLQGEFTEWAANCDTAYERSLRTFYCLYAQSSIVSGMEDWTEMERLSREMLSEAEKRNVDAPDTVLLPAAYRAGAQTMLGKALLKEGRAAEAVPVLDEAVLRFREIETMAPFFEFPIVYQFEAAGNLASALQQTGERQRVVELLEWAFDRWDARVRAGGLLVTRMRLAQCAWQLAQALDPDDPAQATRRREVLGRALGLLDDPETAPRLTPEEQELRKQVAAALMDSPPRTRSPEADGP